MKQRNQSMRSGWGKPRTRPGTRAVALIAAFALVMSMCPGVAALAFANGQLAGGSAGLEAQGGGKALLAQAGGETTVTKDTHQMTTGVYRVKDTLNMWNIEIEKGAKVLLYIDEGKTLTVRGDSATGSGIGRAAILLPEGSTLIVAGKGTLNAYGGDAGNGESGGGGGKSTWSSVGKIDNVVSVDAGVGGRGGNGGGGAGAGIGTNGGAGGAGGPGGRGAHTDGLSRSNAYGGDGGAGSPGALADPAGTLIVTGSATVNAKGGGADQPYIWTVGNGVGGGGGNRGNYSEANEDYWVITSAGTAGGGGGGGGGGGADGIGSGGTGGGGGGGGGGGNIDGECAFFGEGDLDDLWGYGGYGGSSSWGGGGGARGDYGASGKGDDTGASKKYAKSGGQGGSSPDPKKVAFYTYKSSPSDNPFVTCFSGHNVSRGATPLGSMDDVVSVGNCANLVSGGSFVYDGNPHGATVKPGNVSAQADGDEGDWPDEGTVTIDGVEVHYEIAYYDEEGAKLESAPVLPGRYAAVVTFASDDPDYRGEWVEAVTIDKVQVERPAPAALVFECADWDTGEGEVQDAFPNLDETDFEFVPGAVAEDGSASLRKAGSAGSYQACFRLNEPATHEWADGTEGAEAWVPWSIALAPFDPDDPEISYWGTDHGNNTTAVDYTGEPVWIRPWYTPEKGKDGRFPEWFTLWGDEDRPTTDRNSSCVFYLRGDGDREGLVGYHTNADGSLEKVTAEQVYAWAAGVEIGGDTVPVEAGEKVWYKTGEDGWKVPLAVGGEEPEGAEGYVVARDYAYADRLGVMEPGDYYAYAVFGEEAGFEATSLAEAEVSVRGVDISKAKVELAQSSYVYDGKAKQPAVKSVTLDGKALEAGADYSVSYAGNVNAGTATATVAGKGIYAGAAKAAFSIAKAPQAISAKKSVAATAKAKKSGKKKALAKSVTVDLAKRARVSARTAISYAKAGKAGGKKIAVDKKTGKVTLKKGLKKGAYKVQVELTAPASANYEAASPKTVTLTVKVK